MKKLIIALLFLPFLGYSQDLKDEGHYMYAEIVGTGRLLSAKVDVEIDYGQETKFFNADKNRIMDADTGKPKKFNSMVDAMNFMGAMGWEFTQAYVVTISGSNVYHWLMKRKLTNSEVQNFLPTIRRDLMNPSTN